MKFVKHYTDAGDGQWANLLMDEFGPQGYAWYWLLVELCAAKYNPSESTKNELEFTFHLRIVRRQLRATSGTLLGFLNFCQANLQLSWKMADDSSKLIEISMPKLLEYADKDTKYNRKRVVKVSPNSRLEEEKEKEEEEEEEKEEEKESFPAVEILSPGVGKKVAKSTSAWRSYCDAYFMRWGVEPPRDKTANSIICKLIDSIGADDAPGVARLYVTHDEPFYVNAKHPLELLFRDRLKILTEYKMGSTSTFNQVKRAEQGNNFKNQLRLVEEGKI